MRSKNIRLRPGGVSGQRGRVCEGEGRAKDFRQRMGGGDLLGGAGRRQ